jgi:hypothetical protein
VKQACQVPTKEGQESQYSKCVFYAIKLVQQECLNYGFILYITYVHTQFSFTRYSSHHQCTCIVIMNESLEITILLAITTIFEPLSI